MKSTTAGLFMNYITKVVDSQWHHGRGDGSQILIHRKKIFCPKIVVKKYKISATNFLF